MFLDDELKEIYERYAPISNKENLVNCANELMDKCCERIKPKDVNNMSREDYEEFPLNVRRVDISYRLFCRKCKPIFKDDFFQSYLWKINQNSDEAKASCTKLFKYLNWTIPNE